MRLRSGAYALQTCLDVSDLSCEFPKRGAGARKHVLRLVISCASFRSGVQGRADISGCQYFVVYVSEAGAGICGRLWRSAICGMSFRNEVQGHVNVFECQ